MPEDEAVAAQAKISASAYIDTLPFELVDMHVDYGFFKDVLSVYEIGSKQNQKISTHLYQIGSMLKECS